MSRYRKIDIRVWGDEKVRRLSRPAPNGRDCWLYLLAARESTSLPGVIPVGAGALAESLRWPVEGFLEAFGEVFREGLAKADWEAGLVWIPNAIRYNPAESPNVVIAWGKAFDELPDSFLKAEIRASIESAIQSEGKGFQEAFRKAFGKASERPSPALPPPLPESGAGTGTGTGAVEATTLSAAPTVAAKPEAPPVAQKPSASAPAAPTDKPPTDLDRVFAHWQQVMGHLQAKLDDRRAKAVRTMLKAGYTADDLCQAIDGCALTPHNMGSNDRGERYDALDLICRDAAHVDRFIGNAKNPPKGSSRAPHEITDANRKAFATEIGIQHDF